MNYFRADSVKLIADIGANHDGCLSKAIDLIYLAAESGADVAKFQNFRAETIVSDSAFRRLGRSGTHQDSWKQSVFEVYKNASMPLEWVEDLASSCTEAGIEFMTSVYDLDLLDYVNSYVSAYKIGSGDVTFHEMLRRTATFGKPMIIATGASTSNQVERAVEIVRLEGCKELALLQCNTNYSGEDQANIACLNLNVLDEYRDRYPDVVLGLSDHTRSEETVVAAVAKGCRIIERHFTADQNLAGPDHGFACAPRDFIKMRELADKTLTLLGTGGKKIETNEFESSVVQRRALRARSNLAVGHVIEKEDVIALRPCGPGELLPTDENMSSLVGKVLNRELKAHDAFELEALEKGDA